MTVRKHKPDSRILLSLLAILLTAAAACGKEQSGSRDPLRNFLPGATVVPSEPTCEDCSIDLQLIADLAEARDKDVITGDLRAIYMARQGIVITADSPGPPLQFGFDGRLVRPLGQIGGNPASVFINATLMRDGKADSVLVLDEAVKTISVLTPSLGIARTVNFTEEPFDMALLGDGDLLVSAPRTVGDSVYPLMRASLSNGATTPVPGFAFVPPGNADKHFSDRVIAAARDSQHVWVGHKLRYAIEKRTLTGELVQILERDAEWFRPSAFMTKVTPDDPPTARMLGIWEDQRGLLWVHTITADGRWPQALGHIQGIDGQQRYVLTSRDLYTDTRVEIIDPRTGELVATAKFDTEMPTFTRGPVLARVLVGPTGWLVSEVWSVRLLGYRYRG
jgi:hypothetical protein